MNDFESLLSTDYGFKPQGKSAPMAPQKPNTKSSLNSDFPQFNFDVGDSKSNANPNRKSAPNDFPNLGGFSDVFSDGRSKSSNSRQTPSASTTVMFLGFDFQRGTTSVTGCYWKEEMVKVVKTLA